MDWTWIVLDEDGTEQEIVMDTNTTQSDTGSSAESSPSEERDETDQHNNNSNKSPSNNNIEQQTSTCDINTSASSNNVAMDTIPTVNNSISTENGLVTENGLSEELPTVGKKDEDSEADSSRDVYVRFNEHFSNESGISESEHIRELLGRMDTAIIYPEPVSDSEEATYHNNNNNEDVESIEPEGEYIKCQHCDAGFMRVFQLREHLQRVHNQIVEKHVCEKCGADFMLKSQLEKHLMLHSPTSQICKVCKKSFTNVYRLQRHMISHDESTELRKFKCPECLKAFKFKHHLKEHIRIHSGEKPFACSNCGKRFSHSGSYSSHMTSKKCWVVNMKLRKPEGKSMEPSAEDPLRPLIPKCENGIDFSTIYANQFPHQFIPFDPTGGHFSPQFMAAHLNGSRPYLPYPPFGGPFNPAAMLHPLSTSAFGIHLLKQKEEAERAVNGEQLSPQSPRTLSSHLPPSSQNEEDDKQKIDENQNTESVQDSHNASVVMSNDGETQPSDDAQHSSEHELVIDEQAFVSDNEGKEEEGSDLVTEKADEENVEAGAETKAQDGENADKEPTNMNAVKKILEIVDATVSQQQQGKEDKSVISKLVSHLAEKKEKEIQKSEFMSLTKDELSPRMDLSDGQELKCRFCSENFQSPVDLHQHERYLCKANNDIQSPPGEILNIPSLASFSVEKEMKEVEMDKLSDTSSADREGRQYHVRSWFSEEQRQILKTHYKANPRPDKYELSQVASQLGLPKRVVQVWFQNTRAQDRRKGIPIPPVGNTKSGGVTIHSTDHKPSAGYIPVVPQVPFTVPSLSTPDSSVYFAGRTNGQLSHFNSPPIITTSATTFNIQAEPLDLTLKKPQDAHSSVHVPRSSPERDVEEGEVLNLSQRAVPQKEESPKIEESSVFKYMTVEEGSHSNRSTPQSVHSQMASRMTPEARSNTSGSPHPMNGSPCHTPERAVFPSGLLGLQHRASPSMVSPVHRGVSPLVMTQIHPGSSPCFLPPPGSPGLDGHTSPPNSLESSFNSTTSLDSIGQDARGEKRSRRKSWRQMEADEVSMEFDDALRVDEDGALRKKRKSWKQHRVNSEEGLYACDQCDKLFAKQSSLARHKYEHSGQRPFNCEICRKAFKHKHHLTEHQRLHSGEKPFECQKCGKRFSHSGSFSQHMNHRYKYCKPLRMEMEEQENSGGAINCKPLCLDMREEEEEEEEMANNSA